uniref:CSON002167 protein n=1 Tax=Culicoides sonorensis TaxID=179676 RepID=A0A336MPJ6_CULSO
MNVANILKPKRTKGLLSILDKAILNTPANQRTQEQKRKLIPILLDLPCFDRFSPIIRAKLVNCIYFYFVNKSRTILRKNHHANAVYFILNGEVNILKEFYDNFYFYRFLADCELLCIYREDFEKILKPTLQRQWDHIQMAMARFKYFSYWTPEQKEECCVLSKIKQFNANEIVYGDKGVHLNFAYFILSGKCMVLQCLKLKKIKGKDNKIVDYKLMPLSKNIKDENDSHDVDFHFVDVGTMSAGAAFGLGEDLQHKSIVAKTAVQCLLIPRYWIFQKAQNKGNLWERIKLYMDATIPSREATFQDFKDTQKWKKYRRDLVENAFANKKNTNPTTYFDIPLVCRITGT